MRGIRRGSTVSNWRGGVAEYRQAYVGHHHFGHPHMRRETQYSRSQLQGNELVHSHLILVAEGFDIGDRDFGEQAAPIVGPVQPDDGSRRRNRLGSLLAWTNNGGSTTPPGAPCGDWAARNGPGHNKKDTTGWSGRRIRERSENEGFFSMDSTEFQALPGSSVFVAHMTCQEFLRAASSCRAPCPQADVSYTSKRTYCCSIRLMLDGQNSDTNNTLSNTLFRSPRSLYLADGAMR